MNFHKVDKTALEHIDTSIISKIELFDNATQKLIQKLHLYDFSNLHSFENYIYPKKDFHIYIYLTEDVEEVNY